MSFENTHMVADLIASSKLWIGDGYRAKNSELDSAGIPFARAGDINDGFHFTSGDCLPEEDAWKAGNKLSEAGDVVFTSKGTVGRFGFVTEGIQRFVYSPQLCFWRSLDCEAIYPRFLFYWIQGKEFYRQYKSVSQKTDMAEYVSLSDQRSMEITLPELSSQKAIAHILGTLDDKIELNRKTNETLEAMAKALFKSWFVDFDPVRAKAEGRPTGFPAEISDLFPDSFEDSEMGEIPSGWVIGRLEEILEIDPQRQLRRGSISPYLEMKGVPTSGHSAVEVIAREFSSGSKFRNGDTLLARITPCLENGKTAFVDFLKDGETGWGSTEFIVMCGRQQEVNPFAYYLARSEAFRNNAIQNMVGSSGRQRVPSDAVSGFTLPLPPEEILGKFGLLATDLMRRISANADQSLILSKIRDALLQKLISGEIRIPVDENLRRLGYVAS